MKATGIVRRIDDLGRVVIPKEIRRTMRIRDGDPLEIYTGPNEEVVFKKYSPVGEMSEFAVQYADVMARVSGTPVMICDRDHVIAVAGESKKEYLEQRLSRQLEQAMEDRQPVVFRGEGKPLLPVEGRERAASVMVPILAAGDVAGCVCFLADDKGTTPAESDVRLAQVAAGFLGKQMEE